MNTLFEQLLQALNVPYTHKYTREAYLQHPDRNNLWGINGMLNAYGVENVTIAIDDKDKLCELSFPLLAEFSQDLAIVLKASPEVESLGRVLTKEELKAIIGGAEATVKCTCKLHLKVTVNGLDYWRTQGGEPNGKFITKSECDSACTATCNSTMGCDHAEGVYSYSEMSGSGVGS